MCRTILGALLGALLLLATPVAAREKPLLNPGEHLPLLVEDPPDGLELEMPDPYHYGQANRGLMAAGFSAADRARADEAAAIVAPLFDGLSLADDVVAEIERSLDRTTFGQELGMVRHAGRFDDLRRLDVDRPVLLTSVALQARDFTRLFVVLRMQRFDPATYDHATCHQGRAQHALVVTFEVRFPELVPTEKRLENARRLAALGPGRVVPAIRGAVPELVAMLNYEVQRAGRKEKRLGTKQVRVADGGRHPMKIVRDRGERYWMRGGWLGLFSVPKAAERALERRRQVGSRGRALPPPRKDGAR